MKKWLAQCDRDCKMQQGGLESGKGLQSGTGLHSVMVHEKTL